MLFDTFLRSLTWYFWFYLIINYYQRPKNLKSENLAKLTLINNESTFCLWTGSLSSFLTFNISEFTCFIKIYRLVIFMESNKWTKKLHKYIILLNLNCKKFSKYVIYRRIVDKILIYSIILRMGLYFVS